MMDFYLIFFPREHSIQWEAMSESFVPDPAAFPDHWYKRYQFPQDKSEEAFKKLIKIRDEMNEKRSVPSTKRNIFPEEKDILE